MKVIYTSSVQLAAQLSSLPVSKCVVSVQHTTAGMVSIHALRETLTLGLPEQVEPACI